MYVIIAFHLPDPDSALRQVDSMARQSDVAVRIVAVLDGAETAGRADLRDLLQRNNAVLAVNERPLGVRDAFARGLSTALELSQSESDCFAYCDQDDVWHDRKLYDCLSALRSGSLHLVHCDARVVDAAGAERAASLHRFETRRQAHNLLQAILLNAVTGMTTLFTRDAALLASAVMTRYRGALLHDHVTAVAAASKGKIGFLDKALVDYVQHDGNQIGARLRRSPWRRRAMGLSHVAMYRETSARLFEERRGLCLALAENGMLPARMATLFLTGERPSLPAFLLRYFSAVASLVMKGQGRRAMLCLRMMDAALTMRRRMSGR